MSNITDVQPVIFANGDRVEIKAKGITVIGTVTYASNPMVNKDGFLFKGYAANDYIIEVVMDNGEPRNWHGTVDGGTIRKIG